MYKIVIADDEKIIRKGLCNFINWNAIGFQVVNSFGDGQEVIEYLKTEEVDVILTDIKMGNVSGLDVAKYVYERKINTEVVIISGYKDFELAQEAIQYNVLNYILKPIDSEEINKIFIRIKNKLDTEREKNEQIETQIKNYREVIKFIQQQFFTDLLSGVIKSKDEIDNRMNLAKLNVQPSNTKCSIFDCSIENISEFVVSKWNNYKQNFKEAFQNFINMERDGIIYFSMFKDNSNFKIIAFSDKYDNPEQMRIKIKQNVNELIQYIYKTLGLKIILSSNNFYNSIYEIEEYNNSVLIPKGVRDYSSNCHNSEESSPEIIQKAIEYIKANYQKDISRDDVAEYVYLNPSYFSRLFKQQIGINFSDYLTKIRIEKAIELLKTKKYKIYEIGKKVGINNKKYFSKVFKKYTGYTPSKYLRNRIERK